MPSYRIVPVCILLFSGSLLFGQTVSFLPPAGNGLGATAGIDFRPSSVRTADFNGDGNMDIVYFAESGFAPYAGVLLGNGDGTFRGGVSLANSFDHGGSVLVADFNGDGKPDVAFYVGGSLAVYLGVGDGTFSGPFGISGGLWGAPSACSGQPGQPVVADVNGDGKVDLICGSLVLLNTGGLAFSAAPTALAGNAVLAADFNRDGHADLLLADASGKLAVALGNGDGTFGPSLPVSGLLTYNPQNPNQQILVGDFNGDGLIDLVGPSADGTSIVVLPGRGDGTFGPAIITAGVPGGLPGLISAVADFNGDGKPDLVAEDETTTVVGILTGNGDGTFRYPVLVGAIPPPCDSLVEYGLSGCGYSLQAIAIADFNNDGRPDLAFGSTLNVAPAEEDPDGAEVSVMLNDSPGNGFTATGVSSAMWTWPVGSGSMVSAFGVNLAPVEASAGAGPWPTTLGGIRLHVQDRSHSADSLAPLLYVSPGQINYVLESTDPFAWVSIERVGSPYVPQGLAVPIVPIAPGLFTMDGGLAAANAVSVAPNGTQTPVPVSAPIDLSGNPVYLSLYGTGFDLATTARSSCAIAGQTLPATYAGPQMQIVGLDQINILLPKSLAGTGETSFTCSLGSPQNPAQTSNAVNLATR